MGGVSMEWKEVRLGDIADVQTGPFGSQLHKENYVNKGTPIVTVEHLGNKWFTSQNLPMVSDEDKLRLAKYCSQEGDVIFSRVGSVDRCSYVSKEYSGWLFSGRCLRVRPRSGINPEYLYYFLTNEGTKQYIRNIAVGATMPSINTKLLNEVPITIPSLEDQRRIASILSSLDRKIELNNKINADLEEMAQAIFKNWFVDFEPFKDGKFVDSELGMIPEGWKVGTLADIAEITMGQSPAGNSLNENREGMIFYQGSSDFGFRFPSIRVFTTEPKRLAVANSVLFSVRAPVGDINVAKEECCIGRGVASIKSKYGHDSYLFYTMKSLHKLFDSFDGEGTVFGSINKKTLSAIQILLPSDGIVEQFNNIASSFDDRIRSLSDENSRLSLLRDTLLPRLMSGELEVPE